ncbi:hypothetical protein N7454_002729 [Penicillium verhagenii]|nr:hypothetical protein N7454_002729 [Penicillium verhagenii]
MHDQPIVPQPQLEIYNPVIEGLREDLTFHYFPFLPTEIRFMIWEFVLKTSRIIRISLIVDGTKGDDEPMLSYNEAYTAHVEDNHTISKLFRVNKESRKVANAFYRVQFSCMLQNAAGDNVTETCYINPECDTIQLDIKGSSSGASIIHFLHALKNYDPLHVGLLSLALDKPSLLNIHQFASQAGPNISSLGSRSAFLAPVTQLQHLYFVGTRAARQVFNRAAPYNWPMFNRALPIRPVTSRFELLHRDPRSIELDLARQHLGEDPREMIIAWREILHTLEIWPAKIDYQFMLAFQPPTGVRISNQGNALQWLRSEDAEWQGAWRLGDSLRNGNWALRYWEFTDRFGECEIGALHERNHNENLEKAVKPAFGFWLFPIRTICKWPEDTADENWDVWPATCSLAHEWLALALSSLP